MNVEMLAIPDPLHSELRLLRRLPAEGDVGRGGGAGRVSEDHHAACLHIAQPLVRAHHLKLQSMSMLLLGLLILLIF